MTPEEVVEVAMKASIHAFIESLHDGYQSKVDELSDQFSGGERQRIGVVRAFLHNSRIILIDQHTSNWDYLNKVIICKVINHERNHKIIVLVSHRLSIMSATNKIISAENGHLN